MKNLPEFMRTHALIGWNDLRPDDLTTVAKIREVTGRLTNSFPSPDQKLNSDLPLVKGLT
jgi:hypothetical protein